MQVVWGQQMREMSELECSVGVGDEQAVGSDEDEYATELHLAVKANDVQAIRKLIEKGARVHAPDKFGRTPLHWAIVYGHQEASKALILNTNKRALDSRDSIGCTALHYAALGGRTDVGRILIDRGAQVNSVDSRRRTPLHFAAQHPKPAMVEMLISRGADKQCRDFREYLPCDVALEWASFSSLACLRPDSLKKDPKLKVHPVEIVDGPDGGGAGAGVDMVLRKGPSLDKLLESWKSAENEARRKKEAESEVAAKSYADLKVRLEEWRAAELDARQRQRGASRPMSVDDRSSDDFSEVKEKPSEPSSSSLPHSSRPVYKALQNSYPVVRNASDPSVNCIEELQSSASSSSPGDSGSPSSSFPDWLGSSDCRSRKGGLKEALLWCTEWEVEHPQRCKESEHLSHEDAHQSPPTSPRERKGKAKAIFEEPEPVWVQVWPKPSSSPPCTTSLSSRSKTVASM